MIATILMLALFGFIVYLIITYIPMPDIFKTAITIVSVVLVILYLVRLLGVDLPVPSVR